MIFGGMIEPGEQDENESQLQDNGQVVKLTSQTYLLDVTMGSIKRGAELVSASYYINNGGSLLCMHNKLYALGFRVNADSKPGLSALAAEEEKATSYNESMRDAQNVTGHKKILHCYDISALEKGEFEEIHEGVFTSGARKQSVDLDD